MKYEETKTEVKERFSKAIDYLNEGGGKNFHKTLNTAINKEYESYPTEQLMEIIEHWPEDKNQEVIADSWKELINETNHNHN